MTATAIINDGPASNRYACRAYRHSRRQQQLAVLYGHDARRQQVRLCDVSQEGVSAIFCHVSSSWTPWCDVS
jgi:hypothetical protein